jgi:hypothetical protein
MDNKVTHLRVVYGSLRLCSPSCIRAGIIGENANEIEFFEVLELHIGHAAEFAAEHKVKQLLWLPWGLWHGIVP